MRLHLPPDYLERVYAGVLGKIIGVYLGRPIEGWEHERIAREFGEVRYYVHDRRGVPLVVSDDDISGTFTFLRALTDAEPGVELTAARVGDAWLNYLIERRTVLWWGGMGNSTEHTAYLRLKSGVPAPESGSIARNGRVVAEQIGAQIFIDGWGMVAPGDPERAAAMARLAASVSHDGEAVHAAQVVAAMEAAAFAEADVGRLLDVATSLIPPDCLIRRLIDDLRGWRAAEDDWRGARGRLAARYGYDRYGGNCHVVPNHGVVVLALLYSEGDFQRALAVANTCGWDTDCNSGNVGCLMGIRGGLAGIDAGPDWRGPVADRLYLPTADGGRCVTDAAAEAVRVANAGRALAGLPPLAPKGGARFHFALRGSVQGFEAEEGPECRGVASVRHVEGGVGDARRDLDGDGDGAGEVGRGQDAGGGGGARGALEVRFSALAPGRAARAATATFIPPDALRMGGYGLMASPTLYPGQEVRAAVSADAANGAAVDCRLYVRVYGAEDGTRVVRAPAVRLGPGAGRRLAWRVPATGGQPVAAVGVEVVAPGDGVWDGDARVGGAEGGTTGDARGGAGAAPGGRIDGRVHLGRLTWDGVPDVELAVPAEGGSAWRRAWVDGVDRWWGGSGGEAYRVMQDRGTGLLIQGAREWTGYRVEAAVTPHMVAAGGIAAHVQGMRRYYALLLLPAAGVGVAGGGGPGLGAAVRLVKVRDGDSSVLAERALDWSFGDTRVLALEARGAGEGAGGRAAVPTALAAFVDGTPLFAVEDAAAPLASGAVALVVEEGRVGYGPVRVRPL